jgi:aminomethyltransferase
LESCFEAGKEYGIKPIGLGARDTLRLEMGFCLYGNDIDDTTSPLEAGLGWITKFTDTKNFIDKEYLLQQKKEGLKRKLVGFVLKDKGIPRQHYPICNASGNKIGEVTSGTMSPSLNIPIGLGYVPIEFSQLGSEIFIDVRGNFSRPK